jgi:vacuolar-type H+-ATPase subunit E/Vma4
MTNTNSGRRTDAPPVMQDEAVGVAADAKEAGGRVASTAKDEATRVAREAQGQAKRMLHEVSDELRDQADTQQRRAASGLHSVGEELRSMAGSSEQQGMASEVVGQLAERVESTAQWLEMRDAGSLLTEVKSFARRRPGVFIAVAAGAGVVAGRLVKSLADSAGEGDAKPTARPSTGRSDTPTFDAVLADTGTAPVLP